MTLAADKDPAARAFYAYRIHSLSEIDVSLKCATIAVLGPNWRPNLLASPSLPTSPILPLATFAKTKEEVRVCPLKGRESHEKTACPFTRFCELAVQNFATWSMVPISAKLIKHWHHGPAPVRHTSRDWVTAMLGVSGMSKRSKLNIYTSS